MILIPIGHEKETVRRLPWITFGILAICVILSCFMHFWVKNANTQLEASAKDLVNYYISHPYLEFDPETKKILFIGHEDEKSEQYLSFYRQSEDPPSPSVLQEEQEQFDQLSKSFLSAYNNIPYRKWGFIPADRSFATLITYMFIHGGWIHLFGNLLFLYLMGPFIEDLWGRPLFASFYLVVGMLSAFLYAQHYPNFTGPLVGASGAIAGVMGAFLIKYWKIKISFFYFFLPFFRGTFQAPAWLMLPLWLLLELLNARIVDSLNPQGGGGVAHWVHVWGFVLGMMIALGMNALKIEKKYIHPKISAKLDTGDKVLDIVVHAIRQKKLGMINNAYSMLLEEAKKNPTCKDVVETLWDFGHEMGNPQEATEFYIQMIEKEIRLNQLDSALDHFIELKRRTPDASISPIFKFGLIKHLTERGDFERAKDYASEFLEEIDSTSPPMVLQNFTTLARKLSPKIAGKAIELCLQHPEILKETKKTLEKELLELKPSTVG